MRALLTASLVAVFAVAITGCTLYFTNDSKPEPFPPDAGSDHEPVADAGVGGPCDDGGRPIGDADIDDANPWVPDAADFPDASVDGGGW